MYLFKSFIGSVVYRHRVLGGIHWGVILHLSGDRHAAVEILTKDLRVFKSNNEELFQEMATLITLDNFR